MQLNQESALEKLAMLGMDDMPVIEHVPIIQHNIPTDWFQQYVKLRHDFMNTLTDSIEEIAFMNLSQDDFINLITGKSLPNNLSIRFRIPLILGGELDIDNLFICHTFPHSHNLDIFITSQNDANVIYLPNPAKKIYIPAHTATGGTGGNATSDRLSQLASQLAASYSNE